MYVLIVGDPIEGVQIIGPVEPNTHDLDTYIDVELRDQTWWLLEITSLEGAMRSAHFARVINERRAIYE